MHLVDGLAAEDGIVDPEGEQRRKRQTAHGQRKGTQVNQTGDGMLATEEQVHANVVGVVATNGNHDRKALASEVGERAGDAEGCENRTQHPCRHQDVERRGLGSDGLADQEQNLEERGEQATHPQRVEEEHAAFGLCHAQVLARLDAHHAAHVANHDAHEHEHDVKPDDEPDAVPDALAHRGVFLGPRTDALHANGHGKAGERQQGAKRGPLLDVLIAREAAQDAADEAPCSRAWHHP